MGKPAMRGGSALVALMFGCSFIVNMAVSIVAPILPLHLEKRGLLLPGPAGGFVKGLLFAVASIAQLVVTPIGPTLSAKFGRKTVCAAGIIMFTANFAAFGFSGRVISLAFGEPYSDTAPSEAPYTELGFLFLCRVLSATGGTLALLSSMSLALESNPENSGLIMGSSETALGVGFSVGPSIGAAFFTWGGFVAPFVAVSMMTLGMLPLLIMPSRMPAEAEVALELQEMGPSAASRRLSPWRSPSALCVATVAMLGSIGFGFLDPTLAPFEAENLGADTAGAGVLFSCAAFPYAILGTVIGALLDSYPRLGTPMVCCGGFGLGALLFLLSPLAPFMGTWSWQILVLLLIGLSSALSMVPAIPQILSIMRHEAKVAGCFAPTDDAVLSFTFTAFTLGEMIGPLIGSCAVRAIGFSASVHVIGCAICSASMIAFWILGASGDMWQHPPQDQQEPLLDEIPKSSSSHSMDMPLVRPRLCLLAGIG
eukprot:TRINITY_DN12386_c0_g2_i1.p1 TRINITY_DN12386_c0_g2~~TRINITY_DN12386_c0_g2_i1.p1  ORF type:complete len:482 (+),score=37.53 TRINITY_DN12386_c0_g2_i1:69-1514(+)